MRPRAATTSPLLLLAPLAVIAGGGGCQHQGTPDPKVSTVVIVAPAPSPSAATVPEPSSRCADLGEHAKTGWPCDCPDEAACEARCDQGSAKDCASLVACAVTQGAAIDVARYHRYAKRGCDLGDGTACTNLGDTYKKGQGTPADAALAEAAFAKALASHRASCDRGEANGCYMLGHAYRNGQGVPADASLGRSFDEKGCALGQLMSCLLLATDAKEAGYHEEAVTRAARVCELTCWCTPVFDARERGSPAAARAVADWKGRCARGDQAACEAATRVEKTPAGLLPKARFTGNQAFSGEELDAVVDIDKVEGLLAQGSSREDVLEWDKLLLNAFYYDHGYLDRSVDEPVLTPDPRGGFLDVHFHVSEGLRYHVGTITVAERDASGKAVPALGGKILRARIPLQDGDWFSRKQLVEGIRAIERLYRDAGYGAVGATPETKLDQANAVIDIDIPVRRGPLIHLARIVVTGNARAATARITKELRLKEGQLFSATGLDEAKRRLEALGVFRRVDVSTKAEPDATHWTVTFEVDE
jgi:hypothetical protein